ncbi:MAG: BlaI/MecI/CopY family transcriptional regulator [Erysipelotrichaceae bacterium]|nr:BlaI/MecI/CopY family transcriptional regulator [Erysipelotrichaceae bacterium]
MQKLSDAEWKVMEVLWSGESFGLGEIVSALKDSTHWSANTVSTYLTRMAKKNLVFISPTKPHRYSSILSKDDALKQERDILLNKMYKGSVSDLVAAFLKDSTISEKEKEYLSKLLDDMEV